MTQPSDQRLDASHATTADARWKGLNTTGGVAALVTAVALIPFGAVAFILWPPPPFDGSALDWFALFQRNWLLGLLGLDLVFMAVWALLIPIFLALYVALRRASESVMAIALGLELVAVAVYLGSNPAFEMLSLSEGYAAAATDPQRATFLAAGQAVLASYQGTAFKVSYVLSSVAGVMLAAVMLRSTIFSKVTGYARLLASVLGLGLFLPVVGVAVGLFSVVFEWIWYVLVARRLLRLGRGDR